MYLPKVTASCNDCRGSTTFTDSVRIVPEDYFLKTQSMAYLYGPNLLASCSQHHAGFKDPEDNGQPQHRRFTLYDDMGNTLGNFGVSSQEMTGSIGLWLESHRLRSILAAEALARRGPENI